MSSRVLRRPLFGCAGTGGLTGRAKARPDGGRLEMVPAPPGREEPPSEKPNTGGGVLTRHVVWRRTGGTRSVQRREMVGQTSCRPLAFQLV